MDCILCEYIIVHVAFQGGHFYEMWDPHLVFIGPALSIYIPALKIKMNTNSFLRVNKQSVQSIVCYLTSKSQRGDRNISCVDGAWWLWAVLLINGFQQINHRLVSGAP